MKTLAIDLTTSDIKLGLDINGVFSDYKNTDQPNFDNIFFFSQIFSKKMRQKYKKLIELWSVLDPEISTELGHQYLL
jgi:hypothetical protein